MKKKKETVIKEIKKDLLKRFSNMDANMFKVVSPLIERAAFITATIQELEASINENGTMVEYRNSDTQYGYKKSPDVDTHIAMTKNLTTIIKQLTDLVPKEPKKSKWDSLDE